MAETVQALSEPPAGIISRAMARPVFSLCFRLCRTSWPPAQSPAMQALPSTSQCSAAPLFNSRQLAASVGRPAVSQVKPVCRAVGSLGGMARASPHGLNPSARAAAQALFGRIAPAASSDASAHRRQEDSLTGHA